MYERHVFAVGQVATCPRILRHGRSLANEAGIIVSSIANGVREEYGLAEAGEQQAIAAGKLLKQQLADLHASPNTMHIYSSPFSRTLQTAALAAAAAGLPAESVKEHPLLRERFFGSALELVSHDNYCPAWEGDATDQETKPAGNEDGESVAEVSARLQQLFQELESRHSGEHILLVSHGDTLSVLQATFYASPLTQHRHYGLATAELRQLGAAGNEASSATIISSPPTA
eukprot:gene7761-7960_t